MVKVYFALEICFSILLLPLYIYISPSLSLRNDLCYSEEKEKYFRTADAPKCYFSRYLSVHYLIWGKEKDSIKQLLLYAQEVLTYFDS